jgi:prepilin signal peptidase PulO-like enzyme (type II secretory pathway)
MESFVALNQYIQISCVGIFGLIIGSFISLVSYRLVSKESIFLARSKCTKCNNKLKIRSLFPLFSWILQRGKCLNCSAKISIRYPLIELFCALGFILTYIKFDYKIDIKFMLYLAIFVTMFIMVVVDLEHYFIPDILQFTLVLFVTILTIHNGGLNSVYDGLKPALAFLAFGFAIWIFFYYSAGIDGIGIDDFKFFLIAGFMLSLNNFILFMFLSGAIGAIFGAVWQKLKKDETFPFAPAICLSAYACLLIGKPVIY